MVVLILTVILSGDPTKMIENDTNERQFKVLSEYLIMNDAPSDVHEALDSLYERYRLGRTISLERQKSHRLLESQIAQLKMKMYG